MEKKLKIILIGAGNAGTHLGQKLYQEGFNIIQIFSRKAQKAKVLASKIQAESTHQISQIKKEGDLYIIAVSDNAIEHVAAALSKRIGKNKLVVHTSGATPTLLLKAHFKHYGSFYPLQTFSISRKVDFEKVPMCIDANSKRHQFLLTAIAEQLSEKVYPINDEQRAKLHVAAVFVNNFSNNLFAIGEQISQKENLPFEILKPLIQETVQKIQNHSPNKMQTGPAIRNDQNTIDRHLKYLQKEFPELVEVYETMTKSIQNKIS